MIRGENGLKFVNDFLWTQEDEDCHKVVFDQVHNLERYYPYCKKFDVAVQAGGNMGVWPKAMASKFKAVYTFEPDWENFYCLSYNCMLPNVYKFMAALGSHHETVGLNKKPENCGGHYVQGAGHIPMLRVDDLNLTHLDFLMLDIEGAELSALMGAEKTVERCKPVIVLEDKGHITRFGHSAEDLRVWIKKYGYKPVERVHRDVILVCE